MCYTPTPHRFRTVILVQHMLAWHEPCTLSLCRSRCGLVGGQRRRVIRTVYHPKGPSPCMWWRRKLELPSCLLSQRNVMLPLPGPGGRAGGGRSHYSPWTSAILPLLLLLPGYSLRDLASILLALLLCYVWEEDERSEYNNGRNKLSCVSLASTLFPWNQNTLAGMQRVCILLTCSRDA
jgi:hypothetical protein